MTPNDFRFLERLRVRWAEIDAQQIVFNGHYLMYFDTAVAGYWRALALAQIDGQSSPADTLSEREFSVFIQLARGASVPQIAATLNLSPSTVGTHLYHIKQKLGAGNQSELTLVALRWGLIQI